MQKRQARIQVAMTGDPDMEQPPLTLIFRGKGNVSELEIAQYDDRVRYLFQSCAWMDRDTNLKWVNQVLSPYLKRHYTIAGTDDLLETLGLSDSLDSQVFGGFNELASCLNHRPFHGPNFGCKRSCECCCLTCSYGFTVFLDSCLPSCFCFTDFANT